MDKNLEYVLANHKELWERVGELCEKVVRDPELYYYDDGDDIKVIAIEEMGYSNNEISHNCFCCDYAGHNSDYAREHDFSRCANCPVDWGIDWHPDCGDCPCCMGLFEDYLDYVYDGDFAAAAEAAYEIAKLPINPIYEEEEEND